MDTLDSMDSMVEAIAEAMPRTHQSYIRQVIQDVIDHPNWDSQAAHLPAHLRERYRTFIAQERQRKHGA